MDDIFTILVWKEVNEPIRLAAMESAERLMLTRPSNFQNGRRSFFIRPNAGELGCGAISIVVERLNNDFVWRGVWNENDWDRKYRRLTSGLRPVYVPLRRLLSALNDAITQFK